MAMRQLDTDLVTIAEAAKLLKVSTVTVQRWLKQGRLPAYHLGPRYIRIRRSDLTKVLTPVAKEEVTEMQETTPIPSQITIRPLNEEATQRRLEAIKAAKALREEILARRGGRPLPSSWQLIRQSREERARRL